MAPLVCADHVHAMGILREACGTAMDKANRATTRTAAACLLFLLVPALALGAARTRAQPCDVTAPDSLAISWTAPCQDGSWQLDPHDGCRLWDMKSNEKLDKDRFRQDLGGVEQAYQEVARRLGLLPEDSEENAVLDLDSHRKKRGK